MYKIIDYQDMDAMKNRRFKTKKEIVELLISFHDIDFTGCDNNNNELSIKEYFKYWRINTTAEKLDWLLEYGTWGIEKC